MPDTKQRGWWRRGVSGNGSDEIGRGDLTLRYQRFSNDDEIIFYSVLYFIPCIVRTTKRFVAEQTRDRL